MDRSKAKETWWFPHNTTAATIARALAQLFSRGGNKLEALLALLKNFPKRWT
jgi:hypothetical protein